MQPVAVRNLAELDATVEDAFREVIGDDTPAEPIGHSEPPPHTKIPDGTDAEREVVGQDGPKTLTATPFVLRDPAPSPLRDVLYGRHLIRGFVAGLVGI